MRNLINMLKKKENAFSLGRVLIFLFGMEILILVPFVVIYDMIKNVGTTAVVCLIAFLIFFAVMFCALIWDKTVGAKIDRQSVSIDVKDGENK